MTHINCKLTWCRHNSERDNHKPSKDGFCTAVNLTIRDKGWGPQCRSFDEMKDCYGSLKEGEKLSRVCEECEDLTICKTYSNIKNNILKIKSWK